MRIVIPTYRRADKQITFQQLPPELKARTTLVVDAFDAARLRLKMPPSRHEGYELLEHPPEVNSIAKKRAWILETFQDEKLMMFDDDVRFFVRDHYRAAGAIGAALLSETGHPKLLPPKPEEFTRILAAMSDKLDTHPHGGFSLRQGNNHLAPGWIPNMRVVAALAFRPEVVRRECELGRIETREDMDYTLQLLRRGLPSAVLADMCVDPIDSYAAEGGVNAQLPSRVAAADRDAQRLAELHPGLVRVVYKDYKQGVKRKEVVVSWKKAYEEGIRNASS